MSPESRTILLGRSGPWPRATVAMMKGEVGVNIKENSTKESNTSHR